MTEGAGPGPRGAGGRASSAPLELELEELRRQLRSRDRGAGYRAAEELARLGEVGRALLLSALESRDRHVRLHAAWGVRGIEPPPEAIRTLLEQLKKDRELYLAAQQVLARCSAAEVAGILVDMARDRRNPHRKFHAMLLGELQGLAVVDALLEGIQSEDGELQEGAFLAFKHASPTLRGLASPFLVQALSVRLPLPRRFPSGWTARQRASRQVPLLLITAAGALAGGSAVGVLTEILRSDCHDAYRHAAISALVQVGEPAVARSWRWTLALIEGDGPGDLLDLAAEALRRMRVAEAEPPLLSLLAEGSPRQRRAAAHALEGCGGALGAPSLEGALLEDGDVHVRRTCARTLGCLKDPRSMGPLTQGLGDADPWTGWNAAWALGRYRDPGLLPRLLAGLEGRDRRLRRSCALALGHLGLSTPEVLEGLVAALGESSGEIARSAAWALRQLDLGEALPYIAHLGASHDLVQRRTAIKARFWLQDEQVRSRLCLPVRSSRRGGVGPSPHPGPEEEPA